MLVYDAMCKACGAPLRWCITADGKRVPLDARPSSRGHLILVSRGGRDHAIAHRPEHGHQPKYQSHFVSCPQKGEPQS